MKSALRRLGLGSLLFALLVSIASAQESAPALIPPSPPQTPAFGLIAPHDALDLHALASAPLLPGAASNYSKPLALLPPMSPDEQRATGEGAATGAILGAFVSAYPAMSEGAGGNLGGNSLAFIAAGAIVGGLIGGALGYSAERQSPSAPQSETCSGYSLLSPCAGQFDLQLGSLFGFTGPGSLVRVREFTTEGTGLSFAGMGINSQQMPALDLHYWFTRLDAIHVRFRYFNMGGSHFSAVPILFNGSVIPGGRTNNYDQSQWFSLSFYYEHRLTPLYEKYEGNWPSIFQHWDLRARMGIEYTYLDFSINGGSTTTENRPTGEETKEDFYHQSMPMPTLGLEAYRQIDNNFLFEGEIAGNWINRWNSLREEGGRIWASQNGLEAHARVFYSNPAWLGPVQPMAGFFVYTYSQLENSHEDGNFIRWSSYGPEVGINWSF